MCHRRIASTGLLRGEASPRQQTSSPCFRPTVTGATVIADTSKRGVEPAFVADRHKTVAVHLLREPFQVVASERNPKLLDLPAIDRPPVRRPVVSALLWTITKSQAVRIASESPVALLGFRWGQILVAPISALDAVISAAGLEPAEWPLRQNEFFISDGMS
jgi:hypothetical protein